MITIFKKIEIAYFFICEDVKYGRHHGVDATTKRHCAIFDNLLSSFKIHNSSEAMALW
jgi:hypothetical protein